MNDQKELVFLHDATSIHVSSDHKTFIQIIFLRCAHSLLSNHAFLFIPIKILTVLLSQLDNSQPMLDGKGNWFIFT